jgi:hypothetical protein
VRVQPESLANEDLTRVFLTPSLREAFQVEALLTGNGVDYVVRVEPCGRSLFGSPRHGAAFYVASGQAGYCRSQLTAAGMELGVVLAETPSTSDGEA